MRITQVIDQLLDIRRKFGEVETYLLNIPERGGSTLSFSSFHAISEEYRDKRNNRMVRCDIRPYPH